MERRLAAILAADVVGYSRLMGVDEVGTLDAFRAHREAVIDPNVAEHQGRIVKTMGDGLLVEFPSVVEAVQCAVEVQTGMAERNAEVSEDRRMLFRIGINIGDVIIEGEDIFGDGVNVAARLEGLAEAGGICISGGAYDQVRNRLDLTFEDMGEQEVKNIDRPVRVWRWSEPAKAGPTVSGSRSLLRPDKPSIAVLPFTNMSGDAEQEYFSDGITEDIITELSRFPTLFVIARNSSFTYKDRVAKVQDIGRELGVQYVLEGSVRRSGNRVRIAVQLIEAASGNHLWAERYDRDLEDIFAVQDEVARTVVSTLVGRLADIGADRARRKPAQSLVSYDYVLRAGWLLHRFTGARIAPARSLLEKAIELDPENIRIHFNLGLTYVFEWVWGLGGDEALDRAFACAQKAMAIDDHDSRPHLLLSHIFTRRSQPEKALNYAEKAVALNPNDSNAIAFMGWDLDLMGRHAEAVELIEKAMRLDPYYPNWMLDILAMALYSSRRYEEAISAYKRYDDPPFWAHLHAAAYYAQLERPGEVRDAVAAFEEAVERERREGNPNVSIELAVRDVTTYYKSQDDRDHWREGLRKAGVAV